MGFAPVRRVENARLGFRWVFPGPEPGNDAIPPGSFTLVGLVTAPHANGRLTDQRRAAAMMARADAANPTAANTLREVRSLREVYTLAVNSVRAEMLAEVPDAAEADEGRRHPSLQYRPAGGPMAADRRTAGGISGGRDRGQRRAVGRPLDRGHSRRTVRGLAVSRMDFGAGSLREIGAYTKGIDSRVHGERSVHA
jgi:hypothetical protein